MGNGVLGMGITYKDVSNLQGSYASFHAPAVIVGDAFAIASVSLSILLIVQHLRSYTNPEEQKWIIGVLFMVPVYATESILSLWLPRFSIACDILRNCYEAFALYSFWRYLVACLGGDNRVVEFLENESIQQIAVPLLDVRHKERATNKSSLYYFLCQPNVLGQELYTIVKFGVVQYIILKTTCSFLALLLETVGVYGDGLFKWYYGYPYIAAVLNFSQMWALYCLVKFYHATHKKLHYIRPLAKFISFKAIVFATWWQGVGIALLCYVSILPKEGQFQNGLQDFLICIEMTIAAVAHIFVFSVEPYRFVPVHEQLGRATSVEETKALAKVDARCREEPEFFEQKETRVKFPGTSVKESVQDVVVGGGEHVARDVVVTITQAIEPVEKGFAKIQETFHHISLSSDEEGPKLAAAVDDHETARVLEDGDPSTRAIISSDANNFTLDNTQSR